MDPDALRGEFGRNLILNKNFEINSLKI